MKDIYIVTDRGHRCKSTYKFVETVDNCEVIRRMMDINGNLAMHKFCVALPKGSRSK